MMTERAVVLARRARFVAAALGALAASPAPACSPCARFVDDCETKRQGRLKIVIAPPPLCVGDPFSPAAIRDDGCTLRPESVTDRTVFATSDPAIVTFDGRTGYARGVGRVTLTALEGGDQDSIETYVAECRAARDAGDAASDVDETIADAPDAGDVSETDAKD